MKIKIVLYSSLCLLLLSFCQEEENHKETNVSPEERVNKQETKVLAMDKPKPFKDFTIEYIVDTLMSQFYINDSFISNISKGSEIKIGSIENIFNKDFKKTKTSNIRFVVDNQKKNYFLKYFLEKDTVNL